MAEVQSKLGVYHYSIMKLRVAFTVFACIKTVLSDTEIVNFSSELHITDPTHVIPTHWPVISRHNNSRTLRINPSKRQLQDSGCDSRDTQQLKERSCVDTEGDLWLVLDLDDWLVTGKDVNQQSTKLAEQMFTLRISSPASPPADFGIQVFPNVPHPDLLARRTRPPIPPRAKGVVYDAEELRARDQLSHESVESRRMFARIRASNARFVPSPHADGAVFPFQFALLPKWVFPAPVAKVHLVDEVAFDVILEPLILGALPESILAGAAFLVLLLLVVGFFGLPLVNAELEKLARRARKGKGKVE